MNQKMNPLRLISGMHVKPGMVFGLIIFTALLAFEMFNYSTTDFALRDLLGELRFANIRWATILTIAFCGIDFAGIARLFTPQQGAQEPKEVWYLFGAWLLAATMNAMLTWWGVSLAIATHNIQSSSVMDSGTLFKIVPIFVAVMVWVIRILIIGTIASAADHLLWGASRPAARTSSSRPSVATNMASRPATNTAASSVGRNSIQPPSGRNTYPRPLVSTPSNPSSLSARPEPTYHSMGHASSESSVKQL